MSEFRGEMKKAVLGLAGSTTAAGDQAQSMTDAELGELLLSGRWSTIEVHEAGCRLKYRGHPVRPGDENAALDLLSHAVMESGIEIGEMIERRRAAT